MMNNHCLWNARGSAEWVILIHAPDCFVNDSPGSPVLLDALDSLSPSISSLLLPTVVFENPGVAAYNFINVTAPDMFLTFVKRRCPMLLASRHMPVFDPHEVSVSLIHEELAATGSRQYTAALVVHHYFQLFSVRGSENLEWSASNVLDVPYCEDRSLVPVAAKIFRLLQSVK